MRIAALLLMWMLSEAVIPLPILGFHVNALQSARQATASSKGEMPEERQAYAAAQNEVNGAKRTAMFEQFLRRYPGSMSVADAFEQAISFYQKTPYRPIEDQIAYASVDPERDRNNLPALAVAVLREQRKVEAQDPSLQSKNLCMQKRP